MNTQLKPVVKSAAERARLTITQRKILDILKQNDGSADVGTLLANGLSKRYSSFSLQKQLTLLCQRELIMRSGITVMLLDRS